VKEFAEKCGCRQCYMLQVHMLASLYDSASGGSTTARYCRATIKYLLDLDFLVVRAWSLLLVHGEEGAVSDGEL
jgi:hypothetical protein